MRNLYTTKRLSAWTSAVEHRCVACKETFRSEHGAAFHQCSNPGANFLELFPLVEKLVLDMQELSHATTDDTLREIRAEFDRLGPFHFATNKRLLVNESGATFACQFMAAFNHITPGTY